MCSAALDTDFDAVVGRHILLYAADQVTALRAVARHLRPGGMVAFQEFDFSLSESLMANETTPRLYRQVDVDTYAERVRAEVVGQHSYVVLPLMVGAWIHRA